MRALYIHTHTHTYIHIYCFSRYVNAPKKLDLKEDSLATGMSEITSSNSFFAQPFMVEIIKLVAGVIFWEIQFVLSKFFLNVLPENSEKEKEGHESKITFFSPMHRTRFPSLLSSKDLHLRAVISK